MSFKTVAAAASADSQPRLGPQRSYKEGVEARRDHERKVNPADPKRPVNVSSLTQFLSCTTKCFQKS